MCDVPAMTRWGGAVRCGVGEQSVAGELTTLVQLCAEKKGQTKHTEVDLYQSDRSQTARHVSRSVTERARTHTHAHAHTCSPKT